LFRHELWIDVAARKRARDRIDRRRRFEHRQRPADIPENGFNRFLQPENPCREAYRCRCNFTRRDTAKITSANEFGSGTTKLSGLASDSPKLLARMLKSVVSTTPSPLKSPCAQPRLAWPKFAATELKSSVSMA